MKVLALIPARGGSKGIPRKNIAPLGGRPLIGWTIEAARLAQSVDRVIVSTDDEEIAVVSRQEGAEVPFLRPAELSSDTAAALPVIRHAINALDLSGFVADAVVYLQPTSPFRNAASIDRAVDLLRRGGVDTVVSVTRVPHAMTPDALMRLNGDMLEFVAPSEARIFRRQDKPLLYARNGPAVLAITRHAALYSSGLYDGRVKAVEMNALESHDIDESLDLIVAEALLPVVLSRRSVGGL